jgi:hypothetical protein
MSQCENILQNGECFFLTYFGVIRVFSFELSVQIFKVKLDSLKIIKYLQQNNSKILRIPNLCYFFSLASVVVGLMTVSCKFSIH